MNSPAYDINTNLVAHSEESGSDLDLVLGTNFFISILPETSVISTAIMDTPGAPDQPNDIRQPTIQIMVRGLAGGYVAAWAQIENVVSHILALSNTTINATKYIQLWKISEIAHVGYDKQNRPILSSTLAILRS